MPKKKTRVTLPGSLSDLVRDLQNGGPVNVQKPQNGENTVSKNTNQQEETKPVDNQPVSYDNGQNSQNAAQRSEYRGQSVDNQQDRVGEQPTEERFSKPAENGAQSSNHASSSENGNGERLQNQPLGPQPEPRQTPDGRGRPQKKDTMREYHIVKDDSRDSWDLFLDLAKQYRDGGGKLATIYIDGTLKNVLDRMKYAGPEKLSTSAILSSIVARFIYDHEEQIRKALFQNNIF